MPRELTSCCFGGNVKWLSLEACLRAKEPFGLERFLLRKEEKMSPIVKTAVLAVKLSLGLACVIWSAILALSFAVYGLPGAVVFVLWSILIYGMIRHNHHRYDRR